MSDDLYPTTSVVLLLSPFCLLMRPKKPLPLETPTILELAPNNRIQVTLFNANHCPGAVMFRESS